MRTQSVGLIGLGLIGGSIGLALRNPGRRLIGCDIDPDAEKTALSRFCIDSIAPVEEVAQADVVFLAVPPGSVLSVAESSLANARSDSIFTDCTSVKSEVARWAEAKGFKQFVPGHPMAGHEKGGAEYASAWLFRGARWILTPSKSTSKKAVQSIESLVKEMGASPVRIDPESHDRHVALLSHLPHALAAILVLLGDQIENVAVGAASWRDLTRVGGVDPDLWTQILLGNREELVKVLNEFEGSLAEMRAILETADASALKALLKKARAAKAKQNREQIDQAPRPVSRQRRR